MKFNARMLNASQVKAAKNPAWEAKLTSADHVRYLRLADELGYSKATCSEHFVISKEHRDLSGDHYLHAVTTLGFIAGVAPNMKLASQVTILPLLNPIVQAKLWATLDWLSGGRAVMLAGVGWHHEEYEMLGVPFHERGKLMDECVLAMRELWSSDNPTFEGKYVSFKDVGASPKPVKRDIPIWFGGDADAVLKRIARWGAGWSPFLTAPEDIPAKLDFMKSQPDYHGRPIELVYSMSIRRVGENHEIRNAPEADGSTSVQQVIDQLGWLQGLGVTETYVPRPEHRDFEEYLDWVRWVAAEIMPHAR